jgi:hypothetical protein
MAVPHSRSVDDIGDKRPRINAFRQSDTSRAIASKLVEGLFNMPKKRTKKERDAITPPNAMIAHVANKIAGNNMDAENMMQLLPDMELAKQVLVSSILSPVDMISTELTYGSDATALGEVKSLLVDVIREHFEDTYKMTSKLPTQLENILFTKGAHAWVILPESSIDDAIN